MPETPWRGPWSLAPRVGGRRVRRWSWTGGNPVSDSGGKGPGTVSGTGCEGPLAGGLCPLLLGSCLSAGSFLLASRNLHSHWSLTLQASLRSSKALAERVLTLPSEDSFPRPQGLHISPLSTGHCPPAVSSRSCTGRWPPSIARTGEVLSLLVRRPVCPNPHQLCAVPLCRHGGPRTGFCALLSLS